jgi:hypothetical protein
MTWVDVCCIAHCRCGDWMTRTSNVSKKCASALPQCIIALSLCQAFDESSVFLAACFSQRVRACSARDCTLWWVESSKMASWA